MAGLCGGYMSVDVRSRQEKLYKTHPPVGLIVNIFISATFASTLTTIGIRAGYLSKLDTFIWRTSPDIHLQINLNVTTKQSN